MTNYFNFDGETVEDNINDTWEPKPENVLTNSQKRKIAVAVDVAMVAFVEYLAQMLEEKADLYVEFDAEDFGQMYDDMCDLVEENLVDGFI